MRTVLTIAVTAVVSMAATWFVLRRPEPEYRTTEPGLVGIWKGEGQKDAVLLLEADATGLAFIGGASTPFAWSATPKTLQLIWPSEDEPFTVSTRYELVGNRLILAGLQKELLGGEVSFFRSRLTAVPVGTWP